MVKNRIILVLCLVVFSLCMGYAQSSGQSGKVYDKLLEKVRGKQSSGKVYEELYEIIKGKLLDETETVTTQPQLYEKIRWNEQTRDAAYEAPNSLFQKKWYDVEDNFTYEFLPNGTFKMTMKPGKDDIRVTTITMGQYYRDKDRLTIKYTGFKATPNASDIASLSARKRDELYRILESAETSFVSKYRNKVEKYLLLLLDEEFIIFTKYYPQLKIFDDIKWTTCYNNTYKKKAANRSNSDFTIDEAEKEETRKQSQFEVDDRIDTDVDNNYSPVETVKKETPTKEEGAKVFDVVDEMPSFPGGDAELMKFLHDHMKYPAVAEENGIQGMVIVNFIVERDGSISNAQIKKSVDSSLDKEAIRLIKSMPRWIPGKQNGSAVRVRYTVPVNFRLQ